MKTWKAETMYGACGQGTAEKFCNKKNCANSEDAWKVKMFSFIWVVAPLINIKCSVNPIKC